MPDLAEIDDRIDRASARPFGRRFHLRGRERATAELRGPQTMRAHAAEIIAKGHRLDRAERAYVVEVIGRWIDRELATSTEGSEPRELHLTPTVKVARQPCRHRHHQGA